MGENPAAVTEDLKQALERVRPSLPGDVVIEVVYDRTELTAEVLKTVRHNLIAGAILVIVVLYLLLGEMRLGRRRARHAEIIHAPYVDWLERLHGRHPEGHLIVGADFVPLARLADGRRRPVTCRISYDAGTTWYPLDDFEVLPDRAGIRITAEDIEAG